MAATIAITQDFEATCDNVIAAMLFPCSERYRVAYCTRRSFERRIAAGMQATLSTEELAQLLDLPSRQELQDAADAGVKRGTVAGDLLAMIYEDWRRAKPEPSFRAAIKRYKTWSLGQKYGDGEPTKYSDMQVRRYFSDAAPSAHLWAALRLQRYLFAGRMAFTVEGLPQLLAVAKELQDFAITFAPFRPGTGQSVIPSDILLMIPETVIAHRPELDCSN